MPTSSGFSSVRLLAKDIYVLKTFLAMLSTPTSTRKTGGLARDRAPSCWRETTGSIRDDSRKSFACGLQPLGLVQPRRAVGGADRAGRSPDRRGAPARRRRRRERGVADRADAAVHPVRDSRRIARRPHVAPRADGGLRGAARRRVARHPFADLVQDPDLAPA